jgi:S-adenosylmethionine hydrolase
VDQRDRPLVALLTDFGTQDHYVGVMKGVILGICPEAALVDITHEVPPQDVAAAEAELAASYRYFPAGAIFLVVVDPGVGSARRPIAAEAGGFFFVAPDNGVLTAVFDETPPSRVVTLAQDRYALTRPRGAGVTFDGRDRFAPAAAWLARGESLAAFGPPVSAPVRLERVRASADAAGVSGVVVRVDRFGNLITNIDRAAIDRLRAGGAVTVEAAGRAIGDLVPAYADAPAGAVCALVSSSGHLEVAVNGGSAAAALGLGRGSPVRVRRRA